MDKDTTDGRQDAERLHAENRSADHHRQAQDYFRQYRENGDDALVGRANQEVARADEWEQRARNGSGDQNFERDGEAADTSRRTWFKRGSVGDEPLQQWQEAEDGKSVFGQLVDYAARSVGDKEHRDFEGAKLAGKAVAAPVKGAVATGRAVGRSAHAAGKTVRRTAQATDRTARAVAGNTGKAARQVAKSTAAAGKTAGKTARKAAKRTAEVTARAAKTVGRKAAKAAGAPARTTSRGGAILASALRHKNGERAPRGNVERSAGHSRTRGRNAPPKQKSRSRGRKHREPER